MSVNTHIEKENKMIESIILILSAIFMIVLPAAFMVSNVIYQIKRDVKHSKRIKEANKSVYERGICIP